MVEAGHILFGSDRVTLLLEVLELLSHATELHRYLAGGLESEAQPQALHFFCGVRKVAFAFHPVVSASSVLVVFDLPIGLRNGSFHSPGPSDLAAVGLYLIYRP